MCNKPATRKIPKISSRTFIPLLYISLAPYLFVNPPAHNMAILQLALTLAALACAVTADKKDPKVRSLYTMASVLTPSQPQCLDE